MEFISRPDLIAAPADALRSIVALQGGKWDQCVFRLARPDPETWVIQRAYRLGRKLSLMKKLEDKAIATVVEDGIAALFKEIEQIEGIAPKVGVLSVEANGKNRFDFDLNDDWALSISIGSVGFPRAYFSTEDIDVPADILANQLREKRWQQLLSGCAILELTYRDDELGAPCPDRNIDLESSIGDAIEADELGRILDVDCEEENENLYWKWQIGAVKLDECVAVISKVLGALPMSSNALLRQIEPTQMEYDLGLKDKVTLTREKAAHYINELVSESLRCSPSSWREGVLTIQTDGTQLNYQLKNPAAKDKATISDALRALCEELCVLLWKNGNRWTEARINFSRSNGEVDFKVSFSYETGLNIVPPPTVSSALKPWWKFW